MVQSKKEIIYRKLKELIINNEIEPGSQIREKYFAQRFGVSVVPVREALVRLEAEDFIEKFQGQLATASNITIKDVKEIFEIRDIIERGVARHAALIEDKKSLIEKRKEYITKTSDGKIMTDREADIIFDDLHIFIADIAGNKKLKYMYNNVIERIKRIRNLFKDRTDKKRLAELIDDHLKLLDAIIDGDPKNVERLVDQHLEKSMVYFVKRLVNY
jgi:DNA-binding GntR family transcriptional regulator